MTSFVFPSSASGKVNAGNVANLDYDYVNVVAGDTLTLSFPNGLGLVHEDQLVDMTFNIAVSDPNHFSGLDTTQKATIRVKDSFGGIIASFTKLVRTPVASFINVQLFLCSREYGTEASIVDVLPDSLTSSMNVLSVWNSALTVEIEVPNETTWVQPFQTYTLTQNFNIHVAAFGKGDVIVEDLDVLSAISPLQYYWSASEVHDLLHLSDSLAVLVGHTAGTQDDPIDRIQAHTVQLDATGTPIFGPLVHLTETTDDFVARENLVVIDETHFLHFHRGALDHPGYALETESRIKWASLYRVDTDGGIVLVDHQQVTPATGLTTPVHGVDQVFLQWNATEAYIAWRRNHFSLSPSSGFLGSCGLARLTFSGDSFTVTQLGDLGQVTYRSVLMTRYIQSMMRTADGRIMCRYKIGDPTAPYADTQWFYYGIISVSGSSFSWDSESVPTLLIGNFWENFQYTNNGPTGTMELAIEDLSGTLRAGFGYGAFWNTYSGSVKGDTNNWLSIPGANQGDPDFDPGSADFVLDDDRNAAAIANLYDASPGVYIKKLTESDNLHVLYLDSAEYSRDNDIIKFGDGYLVCWESGYFDEFWRGFVGIWSVGYVTIHEDLDLPNLAGDFDADRTRFWRPPNTRGK